MQTKEMVKYAKWDTLKGYKYRGLKKAAIERLAFKRRCLNIIHDACAMAETEDEAEKARLQVFRELGEKSLYFFVVFCLGLDWTDNDYGYRLCMDVQYNKWNKLWCIAREHYKSLIITCASTLWELIKDPNRTYCIISYKCDAAEGFLGIIKKWCEEKDLLKELWPDVFWEDPQKCRMVDSNGRKISWTWTSTAIELKRTRMSKEKSVEISGIDGGLRTGGHFSHLIFDDAETPATVVTPESIEKAFNAVTMSTNIGQTNNLNSCMIGTFYAKEDLYVKLIKSGYIEESVIQPCYEWDTMEPLLFTEEELENKLKKMGTEHFVTQMLCDPSLSHRSAFSPELFRTWEVESVKGLNIYIFVDPAGNKQQKKDNYTSMIVVGFDYLGNMMILDLVRDKLNADSKFTTLVSLYRQYRPLNVFYEKESMQTDIEILQIKQEQFNVRFPITPFNMNKYGNKEQRILMLQSRLVSGQLYFCREAKHINYKGEVEDMVESFYRNEYSAYPLCNSDDTLDILASAHIASMIGLVQIPTDNYSSRFGLGEHSVIEVEYSEVDDYMDELIG